MIKHSSPVASTSKNLWKLADLLELYNITPTILIKTLLAPKKKISTHTILPPKFRTPQLKEITISRNIFIFFKNSLEITLFFYQRKKKVLLSQICLF